MSAVELNNIYKSFGPVKAVDGVTFCVEKGEIFGMLGPNGAGKTTSIRILLDIFKPDSGSVTILGGPIDEKKKDCIGYMPEERGLYQDINLERCLIYLASLKGVNQIEARQRMGEYLERFDLTAYRTKKIKELSKGMQQKAQIIATLLHQPNLLIIDEPFSGLDPINTQMVKDLLREQHQKGVTILMCTHQMHQVEELCERLVLIDHGKVVLYGSLSDIQRQFAGNAINVRTIGEIPSLPGVVNVERHNSTVRLTLAAGANPQEILRALVEHNVMVEQFELAMPTLDEIFIQVVQENAQA
jgi:ABC-2 type transport system ATP-binding protein